MARDMGRHYRRIHNSQAIEPARPQLIINHGHRIASHAESTDRVADRLDGAADEITHRLVTLGGLVGPGFIAAELIESLSLCYAAGT